MRVVAEVPHPETKITIFSWNGKYLLKLERGPLEQTYKVSEMEVVSDEEARKLLDETFIANALQRFNEMGRDLRDAQARLDNF